MFGFWTPWFEAAMMGYEAQEVIALRMMRLAQGGPQAHTEALRMVSEKIAAISAGQMAAATALVGGASLQTAASRSMTPMRRSMRANRRRLRKG